MEDRIFSTSRESVDYCVRYMEHLFRVLLEDRNEEWVQEELREFHAFIAKHRNSYDLSLGLDARDQEFLYGLAYALFRHRMIDYPYNLNLDLSILPSFPQLVKMTLDEVANLFPKPYVKVYREATA